MNELEHIISEDSPRTPYTPKETTMTIQQLGKAHVSLRHSYSMLWESPAFMECSEKQKEQIDVGLKTCLKLIDEKVKEQAPKESSHTVVVITWESGMVNVYRKDSKELIEVLIHEHHMIHDVMEAEMIP